MENIKLNFYRTTELGYIQWDATSFTSHVLILVADLLDTKSCNIHNHIRNNDNVVCVITTPLEPTIENHTNTTHLCEMEWRVCEMDFASNSKHSHKLR